MKLCAQCGSIIEPGEFYYWVGDNYLQVNYFDEQDGSDNVFCSEDCLLRSLSVRSDEVEDDERLD